MREERRKREEDDYGRKGERDEIEDNRVKSRELNGEKGRR